MTKRGKLWYRFDGLLSPIIRGLDSTEYMALIDKLDNAARAHRKPYRPLADEPGGDNQAERAYFGEL